MAITGATFLQRPLPSLEAECRRTRTITQLLLLKQQRHRANTSSGLSSETLCKFSASPLSFSLSGHPVVLAHPNVHFICRGSLTSKPPPQQEEEEEEEEGVSLSGGQGPPRNAGLGDGEDGGGGAMGRLSSAAIFAIWAAFIGYCSFYSPNYTPATDKYLIEKLLYLKGDDGYQLNQVLFCLWNIMGLWPPIYSMLLIPSARSAQNRTPVWPFASFSVFAGAFALLPYMALWQPPPPKVSKEEMEGWPLKILDSKILAIAVTIPGIILAGQAVFAGSESWSEFIRYFNSSRFIHIMSLDFLALCSLAPFWVYNDMEVRKRSELGSWVGALSFIPFIGPALYLVLRSSLTADDTTY